MMVVAPSTLYAANTAMAGFRRPRERRLAAAIDSARYVVESPSDFTPTARVVAQQILEHAAAGNLSLLRQNASMSAEMKAAGTWRS